MDDTLLILNQEHRRCWHIKCYTGTRRNVYSYEFIHKENKLISNAKISCWEAKLDQSRKHRSGMLILKTKEKRGNNLQVVIGGNQTQIKNGGAP